LAEEVNIINVDESVLKSTDPRRRGWQYYGKHTFASHSQRLPQVNIIAAVSSRGEAFFTINKGKTNSQTFMLFLIKLVEYLGSETLAGDHAQSFC
jgi:hypothetical protein